MKRFYSILISLLLILVTALVCMYFVDYADYDDIQADDDLESRIAFEVRQENKNEIIRSWKNEDGKYFVFLPSYAQLESVYIKLDKQGGSDTSVFLDGREFTDGSNLKDLELSREYILSFYGEKDIYHVWLLQSANVASMYVNTYPGTLESIYADRKNEGKASVTLYTSDGTLDYMGKSDSIKCRGNTTFTRSKKPFLINLQKPSNLLGMGSAEKWVLLANAYDVSNFKNKIVFDFAKKTSLKWTPDCEYVDLYLDGVYNGLYLLCEKVEVGENRLDIDLDDSYLFTLNFENEIENKCNYFETKEGREIEIVYPEKCFDQKRKKLKDKVDNVELLINNQEKDADSLYRYIDLNTWATRYLIDEFFLNMDGDYRSSYFYCGSDGKIYAGPVWDYDLCMGSYFDRTIPSDTMLRSYKQWYGKLCENRIFLDIVKQLYKTEYKKLFLEIAENDLDKLIDMTHSAVKNNDIRWSIDDDENKRQCEAIREFILQRASFLETYWFSGETYYDVVILTGPLNDVEDNVNVYHTVKEGSYFVPSSKELPIDENVVWIDKDTGMEFESDKPIFGDKIIYTVTETGSSAAAVDDTKTEKDIYNVPHLIFIKDIIIIITFLLILVLLIYININRQ